MAYLQEHFISLLSGTTIKQGVATSFYDQHNYVALEKAQQHGEVLTLPELMQVRSLLPFDDLLWRVPITAQTEEITGKTKQGNAVAIVVHGSGLLISERIFQGIEEGLTRTLSGKEQYAVSLKEKELHDLLEGNTLWNDIGVYSYAEFRKAKLEHLRRYAIVRDLDRHADLAPAHYDLRRLLDVPRWQCFASGEENLEAYLSLLKLYCKNKRVDYSYPYAPLDSDQPQGRLLQLEGLLPVVNCSKEMDGWGRFISVKKELLEEKVDKEIIVEME